MKFLLIFSAFLFTNLCQAAAQPRFAFAKKLITNADSVILISHVAIKEHHDKREGQVLSSGDTSDIKETLFPSFFRGAQINPDIVVQKQLLSKQDAVALSGIVSKPVRLPPIGYAPQCFEPHHAVLVYHAGHLSFIDFCFHCKGLVTSSNLKLTNMDFIDGKWSKLRSFFLDHGLAYEMDN